MENELPKRKPTRLKNFDYSSSGAYFLTICTENRRQILSRVLVGGDVPDAPKHSQLNGVQVCLSQYGIIADKYINSINEFYEWLCVDSYVIMPNHIHILLFVKSEDDLSEPCGNGASRTSPPTVKQHSAVSRFVSTFKRFCNKEYGCNIWQRSFFDHIICGRENYRKHLRYIFDNPMRWFFDELYEECSE